ncbi:MAG: nitrite/sulfite reductase [Deltaproteobacteria bacterium]|nr:nitrite/sulfite reductase [Deltaproteobacteria bacterium]
MPTTTWKEILADRIPEALGREIDVFDKQIALRKENKIEEKLFAETRLRRGAYGQRYDNGQRSDGEKSQELKYPCGPLTKGPQTVWDAPGMMRIKIPFGAVSAQQMEVLSELAEEYSDQILHITTRQDIQLHFVHIEDTPDLMRRLGAVGITTREACGNSIRNVTACQYAGVCPDQPFDVTPYANAMAYFLLGHDDAQDFGRKFKIAFSGCKDNACGLTNFHDLGCIARERIVDGQKKIGFEFLVGGGLGAVPQNAQMFDDFMPPEELLPTAQAICRVFARLGEKQNRAKARIKFLIKKIGIEEFKRLVLEERAKLRPDERWTAFLDHLDVTNEKPLKAGAPLSAGSHGADYDAWAKHNVRAQLQKNYSTAIVRMPLGDFTADQGRIVADLMRKYTGDTCRLTADQNLVLRWVSNADLPDLHRDLAAAGLARGGADTIGDITACPGTDTCKLGISSSRALSAELTNQIEGPNPIVAPEARHLRIKASGCFNSCGQHHVADLGFLGVSRNVGGRRVPHFQLVVGGQWNNNAGSYGLAIGAVPSKKVPAIVKRVTDKYVAERLSEGETFQAYIERVGKKEIRKLVEEVQPIPPYEVDPSFYSDWGDPRVYTIGDMGVGECAGEIVPYVEMGLAAAEREVFEAQELLDGGDMAGAAKRAYSAMLQAARSLAREKNQNIGDTPAEVVSEFRKHFVDTQLFFDPFAGAKFAQYLFRVHEEGTDLKSKDSVHQTIEEAQLFVDASHQCYARLGAQLSQPVVA